MLQIKNVNANVNNNQYLFQIFNKKCTKNITLQINFNDPPKITKLTSKVKIQIEEIVEPGPKL